MIPVFSRIFLFFKNFYIIFRNGNKNCYIDRQKEKYWIEWSDMRERKKL